MAGARVIVKLNNRYVAAMLIQHGGAASSRAADRAVLRARAHAPKETGALAASIHKTRLATSASVTLYAVDSDLPYASYQEWGTGPIVAKRGGVLRFKPKGSGVFIFRPRTRGVPAVHFMAKAIKEMSLRDFLPF